MLTKNVYLLYPAGFSGSYINWAINISDLDQRKHTVPDPINKSDSGSYGGVGTTHLHVRIPTHQGYPLHANWVMYNRPRAPKIYIINTSEDSADTIISRIIQHDPDGVFVNIHNDNDHMIQSYGTINAGTKWPTFFAVNRRFYQEPGLGELSIDDLPDSRIFRNFMASSGRDILVNTPLDRQQLSRTIAENVHWYRTRNRLQPHEVNSDTYFIQDYAESDLDNRIFEISCRDIASPNFTSWFVEFIENSGISDDHDTDYLIDFHPKYIHAQPNLQWFDSMNHWYSTGELDNYLQSHSIIQAQVIAEIHRRSNVHDFDHSDIHRWRAFYAWVAGASWPLVQTVPDEHYFFKLPQDIQDEIQNFGYTLSVTQPPIWAVITANWREMSLTEINELYQIHKNRGN